MKVLIAALFALMATESFAGPVKGGCLLNYRGKKVHFVGGLREMLNTSSGRGILYIDNRPVADFEGDDLKVSFVFQTFKMKNNRGDIVEGRLTNFSKKLVVVARLSVPSHRLEIRNVPMACWIN